MTKLAKPKDEELTEVIPPPTKLEPELHYGGPGSEVPPPYIVTTGMRSYAVVGIDCGTDNIRAALFRDDKFTPLIDTRCALTYHRNQGFTFGTVARSSDSEFVGSLRGRLGTDWVMDADGQRWSAEELLSKHLADIKARCEKQLQQPVIKCVLTVPATFGSWQRQSIREAAELANLGVSGLINDSSAAVSAFCYKHMEHGGNFLVVCLGAGFLEISVVEFHNRIIEVRSTIARGKVGGFTLVRDLTKLACDRVVEQHENVSTLYPTAVLDIELEIRRQMKVLAEGRSIVAALGKDWSAELTPLDVRETAQPITQHLAIDLADALKEANVSPEEIQHVLLVGGLTHFSFVRDTIKDICTQAVMYDSDLCNYPAFGAALQAALYVKQATDWVVWDIVTQTIAVEDSTTNVRTPVIAPGTPIPVSAHYALPFTNKSILARVEQANDSFRSTCSLFARTKTEIPETKKVEIGIFVTSDGVLDFGGKDKDLDRTFPLVAQWSRMHVPDVVGLSAASLAKAKLDDELFSLAEKYAELGSEDRECATYASQLAVMLETSWNQRRKRLAEISARILTNLPQAESAFISNSNKYKHLPDMLRPVAEELLKRVEIHKATHEQLRKRLLDRVEHISEDESFLSLCMGIALDDTFDLATAHLVDWLAAAEQSNPDQKDQLIRLFSAAYAHLRFKLNVHQVNRIAQSTVKVRSDIEPLFALPVLMDRSWMTNDLADRQSYMREIINLFSSTRTVPPFSSSFYAFFCDQVCRPEMLLFVPELFALTIELGADLTPLSDVIRKLVRFTQTFPDADKYEWLTQVVAVVKGCDTTVGTVAAEVAALCREEIDKLSANLFATRKTRAAKYAELRDEVANTDDETKPKEASGLIAEDVATGAIIKGPRIRFALLAKSRVEVRQNAKVYSISSCEWYANELIGIRGGEADIVSFGKVSVAGNANVSGTIWSPSLSLPRSYKNKTYANTQNIPMPEDALHLDVERYEHHKTSIFNSDDRVCFFNCFFVSNDYSWIDSAKRKTRIFIHDSMMDGEIYNLAAILEGSINIGGLPQNFQVWYNGARSILIESARISGIIYAPNAKVEVRGNTRFLGAIVACEVGLEENAEVAFWPGLREVTEW